MKLPALAHIDLDGASEIYSTRGWAYPYGDDPVFESGLRNALQLFARYGIRATLFTIASSLDNPAKRQLIEEAIRSGHEIACHTLTHRLLTSLNTEGKRAEIGAGRQKLERVLGVSIRGFRAPGYLIDRESLELLAEYGYEYDSSAFPTATSARRLQVPVETLREPHHPLEGSDLVELPLPDHRPSPFPFNPSYSLLLGERYFRWGLGRSRDRGRPLALLFHLIDLADPLPVERLKPTGSRLFTLSMMKASTKISRCERMLDLVRQDYEFTTTQDFLRARMEAKTVLA